MYQMITLKCPHCKHRIRKYIYNAYSQKCITHRCTKIGDEVKLLNKNFCQDCEFKVQCLSDGVPSRQASGVFETRFEVRITFYTNVDFKFTPGGHASFQINPCTSKDPQYFVGKIFFSYPDYDQALKAAKEFHEFFAAQGFRTGWRRASSKGPQRNQTDAYVWVDQP